MKKIVTWMAAGVFSAVSTMTSLAGQWIPVGTQWTYQNDSGEFSKGTWQWIDRKCYYFDENGLMAANTVTPDLYTVDGSGAWTVNGVIKIENPTAGWNQAGNTWHYYSGGHFLAKTWFKTGGKRYYFNEDGTMVTGLKNIDGEDYYFTESGALKTKSFTLNGERYVVESDGVISEIIEESDWFFDGDQNFGSGSSGSGSSGNGPAAESSSSENTDTNTKKEEPEDDSSESLTPDDSYRGNIDEDEFAEEVLAIVNEERAAKGRSALEWNDAVASCAKVRAEEIIDKFSHTRPDGTSCFSILKENDLDYQTCGENIAMGQRTPKEVMNAWMNSDGHRKNILNGDFKEIGIGCVNHNGTLYWVQMFYTSWD